MEDAINDLEEQTPKAVAYERCVTAIRCFAIFELAFGKDLFLATLVRIV
jgi:hypothetical protein